MTDADFRDTLRLLDTALALLRPRRTLPTADMRRRFRLLSVEFDLLRLRLGQPVNTEAN